MSKLYLSYIPKVYGESTEFKVVKSLKKCMEFYSGRNNIISSPGYLSTSRYVTDFVNEFKDIVPIGNNIYIGYFIPNNKSCSII